MGIDRNTYIAPEEYRTDGFILRPWRESDAGSLAAAVRESYEHLVGWMPWATSNPTDEEYQVVIRRWLADYLLNEGYTMGILSPDESEVFGSTGFHLRGHCLSPENLIAEVGIWLAADHAGKGLGTQVLRAILDWGFTEWPWRKLIWVCDATNKASARVAEKSGMQLEAQLREHTSALNGDFRDDLIFGALRSEWQERR